MFAEHLAKLAKALDSQGIAYMLIGGQAVLLHGEVRLTRDIDLTLAAGPEKLPALLSMVNGLGWRPLPANPAEFVEQTLVLPCEDPASGIKVDFIFGLSAYECQAIERSITREILGVKVRFASPEDLVIHKVIAGRPRDLEDIKGILAKNPRLDASAVRTALEEFDRELGESHLEVFKGLWSQEHP
jgi:predicted nucleotidyltransferase